MRRVCDLVLFFFNDTATTEIYTLSLHDALPIYRPADGDDPVVLALLAHRGVGQLLRQLPLWQNRGTPRLAVRRRLDRLGEEDRKSTRLNSSHANISYAVFCLKKKNTITLTNSSS